MGIKKRGKKELKKSLLPSETLPVKHKGVVLINDGKLQKDFVCIKCLKKITKGQQFVVFGTYQLEKKVKETLEVGYISEKFFHTKCWGEHFNEKVLQRLSESQGKAMSFLQNNPLFKNLMSNVNLLRIENEAVTN